MKKIVLSQWVFFFSTGIDSWFAYTLEWDHILYYRQIKRIKAIFLLKTSDSILKTILLNESDLFLIKIWLLK